MEYIEREAAIRVLCDACGNAACPKGLIPRCSYYEKMQSIPAADVRHVVRGKWKRVVDFTGVEAFGFKETMVVGWGCSACGYEVDASEESFNFCPNCGARMEES